MAGSANTPRATRRPASDPAVAARRAAREARRSEDWPELLLQASHVQHIEPDSPDGYLLAAMALSKMDRERELAALVAEGVGRFPSNPKLKALADAGHGPAPARRPPPPAADVPGMIDPEALRGVAMDALKRSDWTALEVLSAELRIASPDEPLGYQFGARALRANKRMRMADTVSREGMKRFPDHAIILSERAMVLQKMRRYEEAAVSFARLRELRPDMPVGYARGAGALIRLGRFDEAEALIRTALDRFPGDTELLVQRAIASSRRGDLVVAAARWKEVRANAPDDRRLQNFLGTLVERMEHLPDNLEELAEGATEKAGPEMDDAAVLRRFEALGGDCEFGLAQRVAGIEPLGLLRFAAIGAEALITMLDSDLAGVGEVEHTALSLSVDREYMLEDPRYFSVHTFVEVGSSEEAALLDKLRRRTAFLRDKLLSELRHGDKIFLFRPADGKLTDAAMGRLHQAVRRFGGNELVCVRDAAAGRELSVEWQPDGLAVAAMPPYASKLGLTFVQQHRYGLWVKLCRMVLERRPVTG